MANRDMFDEDSMRDLLNFIGMLDLDDGGEDGDGTEDKKDDTVTDYILPQICEHCGSRSIAIRNIKRGGVGTVGYVCYDCHAVEPLKAYEEEEKPSQYERWRMNVLAAHPTCMVCGSTDNVMPIHIIPMDNAPKYAYKTTNGIVLCKECRRLYEPIGKDKPCRKY